MSKDRDIALVDALRNNGESDCVEFKASLMNSKDIGKYISAIANAAAVAKEDCGYLIWGIRDNDHAVVGTKFNPSKKRVQGQPLEMWLSQRIKPDTAFTFRAVHHPEGDLVLLEIPAATVNPIAFERIPYIRIGSATPPLVDHPSRERTLWKVLQRTSWEEGVAAQSITADRVLELIDYAGYFDLMKQRSPDSRAGILDYLSQGEIAVPARNGRWNISNLGAILFARSLDAFGSRLGRKAVRLVSYDGAGRESGVTHRHEEKCGYAVGFRKFVDLVNGILPARERIDQAFRTEERPYSKLAIRELIANALIHQDMTITGAGPTVELFEGRIEITNPGKPLIATNRFIDAPPKSYNQALAAKMRQMGLCEELGTGIDKVVAEVELLQSPPPNFAVTGEAMRATLFAPRKFADMTMEECIRACYQHAVLQHVKGGIMKNSTLRERFGVGPEQTSKISRVIRATLNAKSIRLVDEATPKTGYVPIWA